jgi:hypothetical protein
MSAAGSAVAASNAAAVRDRIAGADWNRIENELDLNGWSLLERLLDTAACRTLIESYADTAAFRSRIVMARYNFGRGEYQYYRYPLPEPVATLREETYRHLVGIANSWTERLGGEHRFPSAHHEFRQQCAAAGQHRPTPLILRYGASDYNCLHQDLYGELYFPLQLAILLDEPGVDFTGGALVMTEQRPRMQSRAHVVPITQGSGVIFAVNQRPVHGKRGDYRVTMRHGVSTIGAGARHTLGIIFHDAA